MALPDAMTAEALQKSTLLMRFAAENIVDAQQRTAIKSIVPQIEAARDAEAGSTWNSAIATQFWGAYNDLCALIQPVNADTLKVSGTRIGGSDQTLPERTAMFYLAGLGVLLVFSVLLLAFGSTVSASYTAVKSAITDGNAVVEQTTTQINLLAAQGVSPTADFTVGQNATNTTEASKLSNSLAKQYAIGDDLYFKTGPGWSIVGFFSREWPICSDEQNPADLYRYRRGNGAIAKTLNDAASNVNDYRLTVQRAAERVLRAQSISNILAATLLSVILGMTGACAYVVRTIADQIRANSFSSTSAIRHKVRLGLGALAGVAIGFGGFVTTSTVSAAALAFLAGYAIEPVFAIFDRVANSLK